MKRGGGDAGLKASSTERRRAVKMSTSLSRYGPTRRAKMVCTIGPASNPEAMIRELMQAGMDVARLNFSHGEHREHAEVIQRLRKVAAELGRTICILEDLQ